MKLAWVLALVTFSVNSATLYKVVKADGTVIYTDRPVAGAVPVSLPKANTADSLAPKQVNSTTAPKKPDKTYQLTILAPAHEATIRNNLGEVQVSGSISPNAVGSFQLLLDGQVMATGASPNFNLQGVPRGAHQIQIQLINKSGKILASSPEHTFYLHQASVLNRAD